MKQVFFIVFGVCLTLAGCSQNGTPKIKAKTSTQHVGGPCEGCEAIYESPVPFERLSAVDTLPDFNENGPKLEISGIVYEADGKTPAKDVIIYVYHTDQKGNYSQKGNETGWGKRHGYIRGWMKTDKNGYYQFYTLRPASYPNSNNPQHIHITIKEPKYNEYYIDEYLFADDAFLTQEMKQKQEKRGGSGVIIPVPDEGRLHGTRHIILGKNIPGYPPALDKKMKSGLSLGANCPAFDPLHFSGADEGQRACPMCKYGYGQGVMVWFNHANFDQMNDFVQGLEKEMASRGEKNFRVFMVYMNPFRSPINKTREQILKSKLKKWCNEQGVKKLAFVMVPSPDDAETCGIYQINPAAKNTVFVYKKRKITSKWVNTDYDAPSLAAILKQF